MGVFLRDGEPKRFKKYPYGPLRIRLVLAIVCVGVGVGAVLAISNLGRLGLHGDRGSIAVFLWGIGPIVLGVASYFVARWMAKRNL